MTTPDQPPQPGQQDPFEGMNPLEKFEAFMRLGRDLGVMDDALERQLGANFLHAQVGIGSAMMTGAVEQPSAADEVPTETVTASPAEEASAEQETDFSGNERLRADVKHLPFKLEFSHDGKRAASSNPHAEILDEHQKETRGLPDMPSWDETVKLLDDDTSEVVKATLISDATFGEFTGQVDNVVANVNAKAVVIQYTAYEMPSLVHERIDPADLKKMPVGFTLVTSVGHARQIITDIRENPDVVRDVLADHVNEIKTEQPAAARKITSQLPDFDIIDEHGRDMLISARPIRRKEGWDFTGRFVPLKVYEEASGADEQSTS